MAEKQWVGVIADDPLIDRPVGSNLKFAPVVFGNNTNFCFSSCLRLLSPVQPNLVIPAHAGIWLQQNAPTAKVFSYQICVGFRRAPE